MGDTQLDLQVWSKNIQKVIKIGIEDMPLKAIPKWSKELKTVVHNMYTRDVGLIHSAKLELAKIRDEVESAESDIWTGRGSAERLLCEFEFQNQSEGCVRIVSILPRPY